MDRNISNRLTLLVLALTAFLGLKAQDTRDFYGFRDSVMREFSSFRSRTFDDYEAFRSKVNADYAGFLRQTWQEYQSMAGEDNPFRDRRPSPPVVYHPDDPVDPSPVVPVQPVVVPPSAPRPEPMVPVKPRPGVAPAPIEVSLYNTVFKMPGVNADGRRTDARETSLQSDGAIADAWSWLADGRMDNVLAECLKLRKSHRLNDWAYINLLSAVAGKLFPDNPDMQTLALAYLYANSGYKMRLGREAGQLMMLFASDHIIYNRRYYTVDSERFYPFTETGGRQLRVCKGGFPGERPLSLIVVEEPLLSVAPSEPRHLKGSKGIEVDSRVNKNLLGFYESYPASAIGGNPVTRWSMVSNMPLCSLAKESLYPVLRSALQGKSDYDKVALLLNFVQTAFVYARDNDVWGEDRAFFPDETLYYPYSDCEDRAALFTRLVRDLTGLECALLLYPNHLAAAVAFPPEDNVGGSAIVSGGRKYIICDPTYIGAPPGKAMPKLANEEVRALVLK